MARIAVLADCHIHPGGGINWPQPALEALAGADLIVTLGDMGEASGLDALAVIAPVKGVVGEDDQPSPHAEGKVRRPEIEGVGVVCVFDPAEAGLAISKSPLTLAADEAVDRLAGGRADVILWASTHVPSIDHAGRRLLINPGSVTLPDKGSPPGFAWLTIDDGRPSAEIVSLA